MPTHSMPLTGAASAHSPRRMCISAWLMPNALISMTTHAGLRLGLRACSLKTRLSEPAKLLEDDRAHSGLSKSRLEYQLGRNSRMAAAMSAAWVSSAKWPVSKKRTTACGMSRLNASAPAGRKNGSLLTPDREERRFVRAEIVLECRIERDVALVVGEQIELDLIGTRTRNIKIVERVSVGGHQTNVADAMRILPVRGLRLQHAAQRVAVCFRRILPIRADGVPSVTQSLLIGIAVLGDDGRERARDGACARRNPVGAP